MKIKKIIAVKMAAACHPWTILSSRDEVGQGSEKETHTVYGTHTQNGVRTGRDVHEFSSTWNSGALAKLVDKHQ